MANRRKKKITVRHHNMNGEKIVLERKVLSFPMVFLSAFLLFLPLLLGWGWVWRPWRLLNAELYDIEDQIAKKVGEIEVLMRKRLEVEEFLKREKKDITASTEASYGYSDEFQIDVPVDQLSFKKQKWLQRPEGDWRKFLNPKAFPGMKPGRLSTRAKVGMDDEPPAAVRTAYTPDQFAQFKYTLEDTLDVDGVMTYKEPKPQRRKQRGNNQNNQNRRNNQEDYFDEDYDD